VTNCYRKFVRGKFAAQYFSGKFGKSRAKSFAHQKFSRFYICDYHKKALVLSERASFLIAVMECV